MEWIEKKDGITVDVRARVKENWLERVFPHSQKWQQKDFADRQVVEELPLYRAVRVTEEELRMKRWTDSFGDLINGRQELSEIAKSVILSSVKP